jgi:hypothetical protein
MLSIEERRQLLLLLEEDPSLKLAGPDVRNRERDEKGRFLPDRKERTPAASRYESVREIKLIKVKGTYGTYKVKSKWMKTEEKTYLYFFFGVLILALII